MKINLDLFAETSDWLTTLGIFVATLFSVAIFLGLAVRLFRFAAGF